jgi:hypothetical protein
LKKGNEWHPRQSKWEQFPRESLRLGNGQACRDAFPENQGLALKEDWITMCDPLCTLEEEAVRTPLPQHFQQQRQASMCYLVARILWEETC